jgi:hypothetical protein
VLNIRIQTIKFMMKATECKLHNQKLLKFCKNLSCWVQICSKCAIESHIGHQIIEYKNLQQETRNAKETLIQSKRGDILSVKRILASISSLQEKLQSTQEKRKEERKQIETQIMAKLQAAEKEDRASYEELSKGIKRYCEQLNEYYNVQVQEVDKIPSLADAVITKGTIDDLKTFFEMCKEGSENHAEISQYKNTCDTMKKNVEDYVVQKPFNLEAQSNKSFLDSSKDDISSFNILTSFTNEQHFLDVPDKLFSPIEKTAPKKQSKNTAVPINTSQTKKLITRTNSTASLNTHKTRRNSLLSESMISNNRTFVPKLNTPSKNGLKQISKPKVPIKPTVGSRNAQTNKLRTSEIKRQTVRKEVKKIDSVRTRPSIPKKAKVKPDKLMEVKGVIEEIKASLKTVSKELNEKLKKFMSKSITKLK